jgi:predicted DNA binding CopG/RHH family protein
MKLDKNEKELLSSFDRGEWRSAKNLSSVKKHFQEVARETLRKDRRINIRLSQKDLEGVQAKAAREGMPYQTLIASVIHKFVVGGLKEA